MSVLGWQVVLVVGLLLGLALMAGGVAALLRLPRVTAYLLTGVALGPTALHWLSREDAALLEPLTKLAIALVLFNLGCHFPLVHARRAFRRVFRLSLGELAATFVLVFCGVLLFHGTWQVAVLLATLALATAPATTILVLKEMESDGPVTEATNGLVVINNLVSILLFELLFLVIYYFEGSVRSPLGELWQLGRDLAGAVLLGIAGGLLAGFTFGLVGGGRRLILLVSVTMLLLALCQIHGLPYLLTFLAMGVTVANVSDQRRHVTGELDRLTGLLCVVFFVAHGAELELAKLWEAGAVGVAYLLLRFGGKYFGVRLVAKRTGAEPALGNWLGAALVSQAGAAIALSAMGVQRTDGTAGPFHFWCLEVQTVILGTVVVFELIGPVLIRLAVLHSGEVPLAHAIRHAPITVGSQARMLWNRLLMAFGYDPWHGKPPEKLTVAELMRRNVRPVSQTDTFTEVIDVIEHSRDNTYPVVGANGELVGVIRYRELSDVLFDPALDTIVRADDVMTPAGWVLHPDNTASRAYELFQASKDDCIPVVTEAEPYRLVGIVRRRDLLRLLLRGQVDADDVRPPP